MTSQQNFYAVKDIKSGLFSSIHVQQSNGTAIRAFSEACEDENTQFYKHPSDFSLYHMATLDIESGKIEQTEPLQIANAAEFVKANQ